MKTNSFLLPRKFRLAGYLLVFLGIVAGYIRFYMGVKLKLLNFKVFAFYSVYVDEKILQTVNNNYGEEITGFLILTGLFLVAFSKEKNESQLIDSFRQRAFFISFYLNFLFLLAALFFTYGFAFIYALMVNMMFGLVIYIAAFRLLLLGEKRRRNILIEN